MTTEDKETLDIVALIQNNPLSKLSGDYESELVAKIKAKFSTFEQQLFVANFYCYMNYDTKKDFIIELNKVWSWIGFTRKSDCKSLLVNNFTENVDYKIENLAAANSAKPELGGRPINNVLLTVRCFKKLCLKSKNIFII